MSTEITAVLSENQGVTGRLETLPPAMGSLELERERPDKAGKAGLYSAVGKSYVAIDQNSKSLKVRKIENTCQTLFEDVVKWVRENKDQYALDVEIKATPNPDAPHKNQITIIYNDQRGIKYISERDIPKEFINKMNEIRRILRPSQNITPSRPLQLPIPDLLPNSLPEFTSKHLESLEASLEEPAKTNALQNIYATEAAIQGFGNHLNTLVEKKKKELEDTEVLPQIPYKEKKKDLDKLLELNREVQAIDRYAVYTAVASWNNLQTGEIDDSLRFATRKAADKIGLPIKRELQELERKRQEHHWIASGVPKMLGQWYTPLDSASIHEYALDVGDLLIQDRWDYEGRRVETERGNKTTCVEQLIVQMMMNLKTAAIQVDQHPLFESFTEETLGELRKIAEHARGFALNTHQKADNALQNHAEADRQTRLNALKDL
ncbi:MAG: hypothetical protein COT85_08050 [Chlamydiae bacterium CG10_big_fil_rev_8_21_14_0_10_42_34]|nr:MAG: hypothetical protein COT85_08050 [Chlamydiae bacterium CG10_big_fil_rev_8_21_14_0_10_42_34]